MLMTVADEPQAAAQVGPHLQALAPELRRQIVAVCAHHPQGLSCEQAARQRLALPPTLHSMPSRASCLSCYRCNTQLCTVQYPVSFLVSPVTAAVDAPANLAAETMMFDLILPLIYMVQQTAEHLSTSVGSGVAERSWQLAGLLDKLTTRLSMQRMLHQCMWHPATAALLACLCQAPDLVCRLRAAHRKHHARAKLSNTHAA